MKKPPEDSIPTLRDLVFPGEHALRREQSHSDAHVDPHWTEPTLKDSRIPASDTKQNPRDASPNPEASDIPDPSLMDEDFAVLPADEDELEQSPQAKSGLSSVEDDVDLDDLLDYFKRSPKSDGPASTQSEAEPIPIPLPGEPPLPQTQVDPADPESIRAAVRAALEDELDALTERVTAAVLAQLRD